MSKIACFGGSFNPPHLGHLKIALSVLRQEKFDEIWFLPTFDTPLKNQTMAPFEDRVQMLLRLIKPYRKLKVCTIEESLPRPNYTINTVTSLKSFYPHHRFTWIIGSDQANQFSSWKDADNLLKLVDFIVVVRDPQDHIRKDMKINHVPNISHISSTFIREGKLEYTSKEVVSYIFDNELYLETIAKSFVSEKRWHHVKQVEKLALELGEFHNMDVHQITLAALFHDSTKIWMKDKSAAWLSFVNPAYLHQPAPIWHQKTAAAYLKRCGLKDKVVLNAIANHVTGQKGNALSQLIYIADKCEPSRDYDVSEELALAKIDLDKAALMVSHKQMEYIQKEKNVSQSTIDR
ncbi:MAG: nicotinate (nicotinamide) nucleotide adenylyltransferase [Erysipelotrichaceae bacterium]|nr:nicotinate (nicotinamide) nucleotide adenylyltransferase [Erysipelotrichaceae bacterium]